MQGFIQCAKKGDRGSRGPAGTSVTKVEGVEYIQGSESVDGSWRFHYHSENGGLYVENRVAGEWVEKGNWLSSFSSDKFYLKDFSGGFAFHGTDGEDRNLIRPSYTDGKGFVVGNAGGKGIIYTKDHVLLHKFPEGSSVTFTLYNGVVDSPVPANTPRPGYFLSPADIVLQDVNLDVVSCPEGTRLRFDIIHQESGNIIYESVSVNSFTNFGGGKVVVPGQSNLISLDPHVPLVKGVMYIYCYTFSEDTTLLGDGEQPKVELNVQSLEVHKVPSYFAYKEENTYTTGNTIWHNPTGDHFSIYTCLNAGVTGEWDDTKWQDNLAINEEVVSQDHSVQDYLDVPTQVLIPGFDDPAESYFAKYLQSIRFYTDGITGPDLSEYLNHRLTIVDGAGVEWIFENIDLVDTTGAYTRFRFATGTDVTKDGVPVPSFSEDGTFADFNYVDVDPIISISSSSISSMLRKTPENVVYVDSIDEDDLVSDSATRLPTQQSVKAYVDNINDLLSTNIGTNSSAIFNMAQSKLDSIEVGVSVPDLVDGMVPESQLPAYIDNVQEYANEAAFPATGLPNVIYVAIDVNQSFRWAGTVYVQMASGLVLGTTSATAYRGDRGVSAYNHSVSAHAPSNANANVQSDWDATAGDARILNKPSTITSEQVAMIVANNNDIAGNTTNILSALNGLAAEEQSRIAGDAAVQTYVDNGNAVQNVNIGNIQAQSDQNVIRSVQNQEDIALKADITSVNNKNDSQDVAIGVAQDQADGNTIRSLLNKEAIENFTSASYPPTYFKEVPAVIPDFDDNDSQVYQSVSELAFYGDMTNPPDLEYLDDGPLVIYDAAGVKWEFDKLVGYHILGGNNSRFNLATGLSPGEIRRDGVVIPVFSDVYGTEDQFSTYKYGEQGDQHPTMWVPTTTSTFISTEDSVPYIPVLDEDGLNSDSDQHLPTQQSVKAYVDNANDVQDVTIANNEARSDANVIRSVTNDGRLDALEPRVTATEGRLTTLEAIVPIKVPIAYIVLNPERFYYTGTPYIEVTSSVLRRKGLKVYQANGLAYLVRDPSNDLVGTSYFAAGSQYEVTFTLQGIEVANRRPISVSKVGWSSSVLTTGLPAGYISFAFYSADGTKMWPPTTNTAGRLTITVYKLN
jgi:hypothetical protein